MRNLLYVSIALYVVACGLPALEFQKSTGVMQVMPGWETLAMGWLGAFVSVFGWYANLFWLYALFAGFRQKALHTVLSAAIAVLLGVTAFSMMGRELPGDEGGVTKIVLVRILPGVYCWLGSFAVLLGAWWIKVERVLPPKASIPPRSKAHSSETVA